jgi:hypothetical protein
MKKALFCLLLISAFSCNAKDLAYTSNVIGGITVLTDRVCRYNSELMEAYATNNTGQTTYACYLLRDANIYFLLKDDSVRVLPKSQFKLMNGTV